MDHSIWIGWDPREAAAFAVARSSIQKYLTRPIPVYGLVLDDLVKRGLYMRPTEIRPSAADRPVMWDVISDAPMSTQHANARFLVPHLAGHGWALFMDGDMLVRDNLARVFEGLDHSKAVYCVKHRHEPPPGIKMDGQEQTRYARKNWSSFLLFNVEHESNRRLTVPMINAVPGRDLHRLCWLADDEIGELGPEYNYLVGHSDLSIEPKVVHFTEGCPDMTGYEDVEYADEWRAERNEWARGALRFSYR
jgi:lipopolysaccharide biosynthesis glycosyltransferase